MKAIIKFFNTWGTTIVISLILLFITFGFICCLTQLIAKIGIFISSCGLIGTGMSLAISIYVLILEIKETIKINE